MLKHFVELHLLRDLAETEWDFLTEIDSCLNCQAVTLLISYVGMEKIRMKS